MSRWAVVQQQQLHTMDSKNEGALCLAFTVPPHAFTVLLCQPGGTPHVLPPSAARRFAWQSGRHRPLHQNRRSALVVAAVGPRPALAAAQAPPLRTRRGPHLLQDGGRRHHDAALHRGQGGARLAPHRHLRRLRHLLPGGVSVRAAHKARTTAAARRRGVHRQAGARAPLACSTLRTVLPPAAHSSPTPPRTFPALGRSSAPSSRTAWGCATWGCSCWSSPS